jgi:hypothetical protein
MLGRFPHEQGYAGAFGDEVNDSWNGHFALHRID